MAKKTVPFGTKVHPMRTPISEFFSIAPRDTVARLLIGFGPESADTYPAMVAMRVLPSGGVVRREKAGGPSDSSAKNSRRSVRAKFIIGEIPVGNQTVNRAGLGEDSATSSWRDRAQALGVNRN